MATGHQQASLEAPTLDPILSNEYQFICNNLLTEEDLKLCERIYDADVDSGISWPSESDRSSVSGTGSTNGDEDAALSPQSLSTADALSLSGADMSSRSSGSSSPPIILATDGSFVQTQPFCGRFGFPASPTASSSSVVGVASSGSVRSFSSSSRSCVPDKKPVILPRLAPHLTATAAADSMDDKSCNSKLNRKQRNREAASLSRQRQKDYVKNLESEVTKLKNENSLLRAHVDSLTIRLAAFDRDFANSVPSVFAQPSPPHPHPPPELRPHPRPSSLANHKKRALSLCAILLVLGPLSWFGAVQRPDLTAPRLEASRHYSQKPILPLTNTGRHLLWSDDTNLTRINSFDYENINSSLNSSRNISEADRRLESGDLVWTRNSSLAAPIASGGCGSFLNQSETLRLESELRGWALQVERGKIAEREREILRRRSTMSSKSKSKSKFKSKFRLRSSPSAPITRRMELNFVDEESGTGTIRPNRLDSIVAPIGPKWRDLVAAIDRRDDTFYFVSFDMADNLLLLPSSLSTVSSSAGSGLNSTLPLRPRFSIVMPSFGAPTSNPNAATVSNNQNLTSDKKLAAGAGLAANKTSLTVMQIDCEVMAMKRVTLP